MATVLDVGHRYEIDGIHFTLGLPDGTPRPAAFPLATDAAGTDSAAVRALEALWLEERLEETDSGYRLAIDDLYRLDPQEAADLGVPAPDPGFSVELRTRSVPRQPDFGVVALLRHPEHGILPPESRIGPFLSVGDATLLAPEPMARLLAVIDQVPKPELDAQLQYLGEVKRLALECGARLDYYLENENVAVPTGIGVDVEIDTPTAVRIRPSLEGIDEEAASAVDDKPGPTRAVYSVAEGTRRRRIILDPAQRKIADAIRHRRVIAGPEVPRFFENPEAYLPDGIDLSQFSKRVRGLIPKRYNSQPYVRLQSRGRDWFEIATSIELASSIDQEHPEMGGNEAATYTSRSPYAMGESATAPEDDAEPAPRSISPETYASLCRDVLATGEPFAFHEGAWIEIDPRTARQYLDVWSAVEDDGRGGKRVPADRARWILDVFSNIEKAEYIEGEPDAGPGLPDVPEYPVPNALRGQLLDHQTFGYRWLRFLLERGFGGLLADDMGLGKTVQVISLLAYLKECGELRPTLLVLPKTLIPNWHREIHRFCPSIQHIYHHVGPDRVRESARIEQAEIVLTTYQTLRRDQLILGQVSWSVIACDEAQYIKNPTAQSTSAAKGMKAGLRLGLTGTPVENGLSELWCIVDFAQPGRLGSQREFREIFERPIRDAIAEPDLRRQLARRLQRQLFPHYIRRTKEDVLRQLPERLPDRRLLVALGPRQQIHYAGVIRRLKQSEMIPLAALQQLLMISSHPELHEESGAPVGRLVEECPKLGAALDILEEVRGKGEKAVVFTRYRRMQRLLQAAIRHRFQLHAPVINGESAGERRIHLVDRFNDADGFRVLILSPDAAGVGLNITGANHVVHYTRLWNPAKENQATDRVHRIGQTRPVAVYYPITTGGEFSSVEERLDELLQEKRDLARDVVWPREALSVEKDLMDDLAAHAGRA